MSAALVYDIAFVAIIIISACISASRGAFKAISGIAGTVAGCICAFRFESQAGELVGKLIRPIVKGVVESSAKKAGVEEILESALTGDISEMFRRLLEALNISEGLSEHIAATAREKGEYIVNAITDGITEQIAPIIAFVLIFALVKLAVTLVCNALSFDIPVIRTLNRAAGGLLGALSGIVIVFVLCWGIFRFAPSSEGVINKEILRQGYVGSALGSVLDNQ